MIHLICPNPAIDRTLLLETIKDSIPNRPKEVKEYPGGKSFNVAYSLTYEEESPQVTIHTILGGIYGERLADLSEKNKYNLVVTNVDKNTRLCNILVDMGKKEVIPVYESGFELNSDILKIFTKKLVSSIKNNDIVVFSGSLMKGIPSDYICKIQNKLKERHINFKLCVDTSGETLKQTYHKINPYLVKINDEEILDIFPEKKLNTIDDYLKLLKYDIKNEIPNFIITLGGKGIVGRIEGELFRGHAKSVVAKNPIACGDFFLGRLIRGIVRNDSAKDILKSSLLFSTCNATNWYPEIKEEQIKTIYPTITIEKIENECLLGFQFK